MVSALVLITDGSEEIEFTTAYDILVRAGVEVRSAGTNLKNHNYATCSRNVRIVPDETSLPKDTSSLADALILPGGLAGAKGFEDSKEVRALIDQYHKAGKLVAAICAATIAIVAAGEESGWKARVTSHPAVKADVVKKGWEYASDDHRVVFDEKEKVITSRGPGTAMGWALKIAEILAGEEKVKEISKPLILASEL